MIITIANAPSYYAYPGMKGTVLNRRSSREAQDTLAKTIMDVVCEWFDITIEEISGDSRKRNMVEARMIFSHFCRTHVGLTKSRIGKFLDRDHTSVIHSLKTFQDLMDTDERFKKEVQLISCKIL